MLIYENYELSLPDCQTQIVLVEGGAGERWLGFSLTVGVAHTFCAFTVKFSFHFCVSLSFIFFHIFSFYLGSFVYKFLSGLPPRLSAVSILAIPFPLGQHLPHIVNRHHK